MTEYQFSMPRHERQAVARGIARMQGLDPEASKAKNDGEWDGCLMWAGVILLAAQYVQQTGKRRYTLDELLAQCNPDAPMTPEEREWVDAPAVGREII